MNPENSSSSPSSLSLLRNWISLTGTAILVASVFAFFLLCLMDFFAHGANPYIGVLTYFVAPAFFFTGLALIIGGAILQRKRVVKDSGIFPRINIDLSRGRDRKIMGVFVAFSVGFLLLTAFGSYNTYHFTESTTFCGKTCHKVMEPEMTAYQHGSHARVPCSECHIGPGAAWYVKSKLSGMYQVYATLAKKYPTPIATPIKNLRPAQETCEQCHWPKKFTGNLDRSYNTFLSDKNNTPFTVRLLLKVGGSDPTNGPVGGIHWHMNVGKKIEYIATDEARQTIPWIRVTDDKGEVREYRTAKFTEDPAKYQVRTMDCIDCHNRPAHVYKSPNSAVDLAMHLGKIDPSIPSIKSKAVKVLTKEYTDETEAHNSIASELEKAAPGDARIKGAIAAVQEIYDDNFFPHMKVSWKKYPNNIGHKDWPGCFRCHDDEHKTADGKNAIKGSNCAACHVIVAQGSGKELENLSYSGLKFAHPGGDLEPTDKCSECHTGEL